MPGDKKVVLPEPLAPGLMSDARAKLDDQNVASRKDGIPTDITPPQYSVDAMSSVKGGVGNKAVAEQGVHYPLTSCYDYQYPGHNGTYSQLDGSGHLNSGGDTYTDNGSLLYYMPSYNPYATGTFVGVDGQQPYFSSSEGMPCYSWNSTYTGDATNKNVTSWSTKSAMESSGSSKSNGFDSKRSVDTFSRTSNYPLDMNSRQSTSSIPKSILQSQHLRSMNKLGSGYQSGGLAKGYQSSGNFSSFAYQNQGMLSNYSMNYASNSRAWNDSDRYRAREKSYTNVESDELTRGPRAQSSTTSINLNNKDEKTGLSFTKDQYNLEEFQTKYDRAKFYVIKSYSEDDVHKCIKYDVWSSTPNGNKKLDAAFRDAEKITTETGAKCPVFLFFSVNGSGQFVGVAEMIGPVDYEKNMDFWQLDKWNGFFPVKWHVIKDIPNTQLRHIILENNDNRPVTYTRDTQEIGLKQGLEMLEIFKSYSSKTSLLDDISFYENREKLLKGKRINKAAFQQDRYPKDDFAKNPKSGERITGEGSMSSNGLSDRTSSLINRTRNLSLNSNNLGDKSASKS